MTTATTEPIEMTTGPNDEVLTPNERAKQLFPVLSEYAAKLGGLSDKLLMWQESFGARPWHVVVIDCARLICLQDTLGRRVIPIIGTASTLLNHAKLDDFIGDELALRWDEAEEQFRQSKLVFEEVVEFLKSNKSTLNAVRVLIEKSGRYKSPV